MGLGDQKLGALAAKPMLPPEMKEEPPAMMKHLSRALYVDRSKEARAQPPGRGVSLM
jgi:hypothetical protein